MVGVPLRFLTPACTIASAGKDSNRRTIEETRGGGVGAHVTRATAIRRVRKARAGEQSLRGGPIRTPPASPPRGRHRKTSLPLASRRAKALSAAGRRTSL